MNPKHTIITTIILATSFAASGVQAQASGGAVAEQAISIAPAFTTSTRAECTTGGSAPGWLGQALGGVLGAGLGSQVGKGTGNSAAAAAGAVLGAQVGAAMSNGGGTQTTQTCRDIIERTLTGYMLRTSGGRDVFVPLQLVNSFNAANR